MPISQARMLALVAAAEDYEQAWMKVRRAYMQIAENIQTRKTTLEQAWPELDFMFTSQLFLADPENTFKTIARESAHFKATAKRNEKSAQWQREKRAGRPARSPEEVQERIAASNQKRTLSRHSSEANIEVINKGTDSTQVQADSELEFEPAQPDPESQAKILRDLETLKSAEDYKAQYGDDSKPGLVPKED